MICPYCGNQIDDDAESCASCGAELKHAKEQVPQQPEQPNFFSATSYEKTVAGTKVKKGSHVILIILILIIALIIFFVASKLLKNDNNVILDNNENKQNIENSVVDKNDTTNNENTADQTADSGFLMAIEDVFVVSGKGTVVTGRIERGTLNVNDKVQLIGIKEEIITTTVTGIEMFRKIVDHAEAGDDVGVLLKDVNRDEVERGQVLAKPNSIKAVTKFEAEVDMLTEEEGGRSAPLPNKSRPQFYFRTTDITGLMTLPDGIEMISPGDTNVKMTVELLANIAIEVGTEFTIREGAKTIGTGKVTKIY